MLTKSDISKIGQVLSQAFKPIKQDVSVLKKDTKKIKSTLDDFVDYFDKNYLDHEKRIGQIENHLKLANPPLFT